MLLRFLKQPKINNHVLGCGGIFKGVGEVIKKSEKLESVPCATDFT